MWLFWFARRRLVNFSQNYNFLILSIRFLSKSSENCWLKVSNFPISSELVCCTSLIPESFPLSSYLPFSCSQSENWRYLTAFWSRSRQFPSLLLALFFQPAHEKPKIKPLERRKKNNSSTFTPVTSHVAESIITNLWMDWFKKPFLPPFILSFFSFHSAGKCSHKWSFALPVWTPSRNTFFSSTLSRQTTIGTSSITGKASNISNIFEYFSLFEN